MVGTRPLAVGFVLSGWGVFLVWGLLVFLSPPSFSVSFSFNDDLGTPPTWRPHSWKKCLQFAAPSSCPSSHPSSLPPVPAERNATMANLLTKGDYVKTPSARTCGVNKAQRLRVQTLQTTNNGFTQLQADFSHTPPKTNVSPWLFRLVALTLLSQSENAAKS